MNPLFSISTLYVLKRSVKKGVRVTKIRLRTMKIQIVDFLNTMWRIGCPISFFKKLNILSEM